MKFELFGGVVSGKINSLSFPDSIKMEWRLKDWPSGHFSDVELKFTESTSGTKLNLVQKFVPSESKQKTSEGWKRYYFLEIKRTLGLGNLMM